MVFNNPFNFSSSRFNLLEKNMWNIDKISNSQVNLYLLSSIAETII